MSRLACVIAAGLALALVARAQAGDFDFEAPADADDPAAAAAVRDLAGRVLPVYQDGNAERYLSNLSALQLVAGNFAAANGTRQALRERRQGSPDGQARMDARETLLDLYAQARSLEAEEQLSFGEAFDRTFVATVQKLPDREAYGITGWPGSRPGELQEAAQRALDSARSAGHLDQAQALQLIWTWLAFDLWRSVGPGLEVLAADENERRYVVDDDVPIKTSRGTVLRVSVVRPKNAAGKLPALLELMTAMSVDDARASAAHGYAGIAYVRRSKGERGGLDARSVIAWTARQTWSDGRVALLGQDDTAPGAWATAALRPRALGALLTQDAVAPAKPVLTRQQFAALAIPVLAMTGDCGSAGDAAQAGTVHYFHRHTRYNKHAKHTLLLGACKAADLRELRYQWLDHIFKGAPVPAVLTGRAGQ